jgi:hypothetical protein
VPQTHLQGQPCQGGDRPVDRLRRALQHRELLLPPWRRRRPADRPWRDSTARLRAAPEGKTAGRGRP